jgi:putative redox protein
VRLEWRDGLRFVARNSHGHEVQLESTLDPTAARAAASPMELVLVALGGCSAMDVISILGKMRQQVTGYDVEVEGHRAAEQPKVYTSIEVRHRVRGAALSETQVRRAIQLSISAYCPVHAMLAKATAIAVTYRLVDDKSGEIAAEGAVFPSDEPGAP